MKKNYILALTFCLSLANSFAQTGPLENGTLVATENFDGLDASTHTFTLLNETSRPDIIQIFTDNTDTYQYSADLTAAADNGGTGLGVEIFYGASNFGEGAAILHTFTNVAAGTYIIKFDHAFEYASDAGIPVISDGTGTNNAYNIFYDFIDANTFKSRYTSEITINSVDDIEFIYYLDTGNTFINQIDGKQYIDNLELIKMDDNLPTTIAGEMIVQTEDFDTASTAPTSSGTTNFTTGVKLSMDADVAGTGQGVEFRYAGTGSLSTANQTIDAVTFTNVPAGDYYIKYDFQAQFNGTTSYGAFMTNYGFRYFANISDGTTTTSNYIEDDTAGSFVKHRTKSISIDATSDISFP